MQTEKYVRKPLVIEIDAVQVTAENMGEVAAWCKGKIRVQESDLVDVDSDNYISVKVQHPLNRRQSQAFVNDWVLKAKSGFRVYTPKSFRQNFQLAMEEPVGEPSCERFHSGEACKPGKNHPGVNPNLNTTSEGVFQELLTVDVPVGKDIPEQRTAEE